MQSYAHTADSFMTYRSIQHNQYVH